MNLRGTRAFEQVRSWGLAFGGSYWRDDRRFVPNLIECKVTITVTSKKTRMNKANFLFVVNGWLCVSRLRVEANLRRR